MKISKVTQADVALKAAGIPIEGVSGSENSPVSTWEIQFKADATGVQRQIAADMLNAMIFSETIAESVDEKLKRFDKTKIKSLQDLVDFIESLKG